MSEPTVVTLADRDDVYTFRSGDPLACTTGLEAPRLPRLPRWVRRLTWWRQTRYTVDAVDVAAGKLGLVRLRWSWRRWRWERVV
jgi:hypothetical protein